MGESRSQDTVMARLMWSLKITLMVVAPFVVLLWAIEMISLLTMIMLLIAPLILLNIKWVFEAKPTNQNPC